MVSLHYSHSLREHCQILLYIYETHVGPINTFFDTTAICERLKRCFLKDILTVSLRFFTVQNWIYINVKLL